MNGIVTAKTADGAQKVIDHYKELFERDGWTIGNQSMTTAGGGSLGSIGGKLEGRSVNVSAAEQPGECQVTIPYNGKA